MPSLWAKHERAEDAAMPIDERLNGKWRLLYSSTFAGQGGGTQGFTGAPTGGGPLRLGQVYQRVQARRKLVDNIVEFSTPDAWPFASINATATLSHGCAPLEPRGAGRCRHSRVLASRCTQRRVREHRWR